MDLTQTVTGPRLLLWRMESADSNRDRMLWYVMRGGDGPSWFIYTNKHQGEFISGLPWDLDDLAAELVDADELIGRQLLAPVACARWGIPWSGLAADDPGRVGAPEKWSGRLTRNEGDWFIKMVDAALVSTIEGVGPLTVLPRFPAGAENRLFEEGAVIYTAQGDLRQKDGKAWRSYPLPD